MLYLSVIILPDPASNLMPTQIKRLELDFINAKFFRRRMLRRLVLHQSLFHQFSKSHSSFVYINK